MIAGLPMYERPETAAAHDAFWQTIRDRLRAGGIDAPDALTRDIDVWDLWRDPGLVLAQTCGLPYRARLHGQVQLVGTPDYGLPDCPPGYYHSVLIVRAGDRRSSIEEFADATLAFNEPLSQSGWAAVAELGVGFAAKLQTGAHRNSALAVAEGRADIAGIDAVTWRMLDRFEPSLTAGLRALDRTAPRPGLPYICGPDIDPGPVFAAVEAAIDALPRDLRDMLGIRALISIPRRAYLDLPLPPDP